ncbi:MAG: alpha-glucosidase [Clostridiales bacterium]|jgi:oligo-1,6-glucosidase|nr:alpha-glucosidase [Clostridiales bacterium]
MKDWVKEAIVYQIYPRSFLDTNGDGIGDLPGIIQKLDYLRDLGVNALWLSPVYASPNDDNGYDISDYYSVNPEFGTLSDLQKLIGEAKARGIRILMDLVINHTSVEHPWFQASRDPQSPYHEYYIWREGLDGGKRPPNNWTSFFGGGAWERDEQNGLYYLHLFSPKMADLNYNHAPVAEEIKRIMRYWLDMGIAGFRCDVINVISKRTLQDGRKRFALTGREHYLSAEGCHTLLKSFREDVLSEYDCFTVGETVMVTPKTANELCKELDMVFSFAHMETDQINNKWFKTRFKPHKFFNVLETWQSGVAWNANYFENHDQPRSVSRFGYDLPLYRYYSATSLATVLLALRGTPYIYAGQEIGMTNGYFTGMGDIRDTESFNINALAKKLRFPEKFRWKLIMRTSRDNARTPMQWNGGANGGFTEGEPWLGVNRNASYINAEADENAENSIIQYYRRLILLRKTLPSLIDGNFTRLPAPAGVFAFRREFEGEAVVAVCSLVKNERALFKPVSGEVLAGNYIKPAGNEICLRSVRPYEAILLRQK